MCVGGGEGGGGRKKRDVGASPVCKCRRNSVISPKTLGQNTRSRNREQLENVLSKTQNTSQG